MAWQPEAMATERIDPPHVADERSMLDSWLDYHRATLVRKAEGLDRDQLATASCPPSNLTLLGLLRHMTDVERGWFRKGVADEDVPYVLDYGADDDAEFTQVAGADIASTFDAFSAETGACRAAVADISLDATFLDGDHPVSLRWVMVHMIEEYARHNGHADLLREAIDGATGD